MKYKYFVCSDTHGFHFEFLKYLYASGFDENNECHILVICGDISDKGCFFKEHLLFLYNLYLRGKLVLLRGNHDYALIGFLTHHNVFKRFYKSGLVDTVNSLLDNHFSFEDFKKSFSDKDDSDVFTSWQSIASSMIRKKYPFILDFFNSFLDYYETDNYIFTHGSIDYKCADWHNPMYKGKYCEGWTALHFISPLYYKHFVNNTGKTLIVGHLNADLMRFTLENIQPNPVYQMNSIYYNEQLNVYFLDALTSHSRRINFLVLEDSINEKE